MTEKKCKQCGNVKNSIEFYVHLNNSDGLSGKCKECIKSYARSKRASLSDEEKIKRTNYHKKYRNDPKNKDRIKELSKGYLRKAYSNPEKRQRIRENAMISSKKFSRKESLKAYMQTDEAKKKYYENTKRYDNKYPEKKLAKAATAKMERKFGHLHHWSYNKPHYKDVIELSPKDHASLHRFITYDQERMMYRRIDNLLLLDTREAHENYFIELRLNNKL